MIVRKSLNEAKLNLPKDYIDKIHDIVREKYGFSGPAPHEMHQLMSLLMSNLNMQRGHEDELTEIGTAVILKYYGEILDDVNLDLKIVSMDDEEKKEMAQKMSQEMPAMEPAEAEGIEDEIDKRKIINNITQGEAQNVHTMIFDVKDEVEELTGSDDLIENYLVFLELNKKADWDFNNNLEEMVAMMPGGVNAMEVKWEKPKDWEPGDDDGEDGDEEEGGEEPTIKVRALDLPMLIHETVKGIYELIAANAIPEDTEVAKRVLAHTDTLKDEQEDIRYGPYIAKDLRNYINKIVDEQKANDIPNIREFIFGEMVMMDAPDFVKMVAAIIQDEEGPKDKIVQFIKNIKKEFEEYREEDFSEPEEEPTEISAEPEKFSKEKTYADMSKSELNNALNQAIDDENWNLAKEIQSYMKEHLLIAITPNVKLLD